MGIRTTFQMDDENETFVTQSDLEAVPRVGEKIWFVPAGSKQACEVVDVCYWIAVENGNSYQAACVYLKEI